jgi:hypothetical protein
MINFYTYYIHPSSTARSKLAIHLNAQTPATSGVTAALEKGMSAIGLDKESKSEESGEVQGNGTTPFVIKDVREFKAQCLVSPGPHPVKHISEYVHFPSQSPLKHNVSPVMRHWRQTTVCLPTSYPFVDQLTLTLTSSRFEELDSKL